MGAPLVTLACAGTAYFLANRIVAWAAERMGTSLPSDVGPVLVVLLLGVTTDYSVFFLSGMRANLAQGVRRLPAARLATAEFAPIILAAGVIVAATTAALLVSTNQSAGLANVRLEVGGETALTGDAISSVLADLGRIVAAILVISLILLAVFLRSLAAPVYLLFASVLAVFASLGLSLLLCYDVLGYHSLVYFVPIAGGVLLVSLGSDYNVFVVGRIWEEARRTG